MPRTKRREFTPDQKAQIVRRATDEHGTIRCEKCRLALKKGQYEIDHVIAEALRPDADKQKRITIAEGQLLGTDCCHRGADGKTNDDVKRIAKAKAQEMRDLGIETKVKSKIPTAPKAPKPARDRIDFTARRNPFTREEIR